MRSYRLIATEPEGLFVPRRVTLLTKATVGERQDFFWAEVDAPFEVGKYGNNPETKTILIAPRHYGYSLEDLNQLPLDVYICRAKESEGDLTESLRQGDVSIMAWALLLSPDDDRTSLKEIYESMTAKRGNVYYINPVRK